MISVLHKRIVQLTCVACATLLQTRANAWSLFKEEPPPPPTWQDKVKSAWNTTKEWCSFKEEPPPPPTWRDKAKAAWNSTKEWCSFKEEPPPPPTWQDKAKAAWNSTKEWSADKWDNTKQWCSDHKEEIYVGAAVVGAIAVYILTQDSNSSPSTYNGNSSPSTYNTGSSYSSSYSPYSSTPSYSYGNNRSIVAPGRPFSQSQKFDILRQNMERNGGVLRSDLSGKELVMPKQCLPGVSPSPLEAQIDHVYPRSLGGPNSAANAQVLSREENIMKSNHVD